MEKGLDGAPGPIPMEFLAATSTKYAFPGLMEPESTIVSTVTDDSRRRALEFSR